ncbi:MAG: hypothetical protein KGM44_14210, partial [bacterium]|nr:hypothetical protein [bacterium]
MRAVSELTDAGSAEAIGAAWLERALEPASSFGRRARDGCRPFLPGQERDASTAIERVLAAAARCDGVQAQGLRASLRAIPDPSATLARLATGEVLDDVEIYELARYLDALRAFGERAAEHLPAELLPESFAELHAALAGGRRGGGFYLDDGYAQGLGAARAAAEAADSAYACER